MKKSYFKLNLLTGLIIILSFVITTNAATKTTTQKKSASAPLSETELRNKIVIEAKNFLKAQNELETFKAQIPQFKIVGKITSTLENGSLIIWGQAYGTGDFSPNSPGWLIEKGNILVIEPEQSLINYVYYAGGTHYYIKDEQGTNAFGGAVTVKVYGPITMIPKFADKFKSYQAAENNIKALVTKLDNYIINAYKAKLPANNFKNYKEYADKCYNTYRFLKDQQVSEYSQMASIANEYYEKALMIEPSDLNVKLAMGKLAYFSYDNEKATGYFIEVASANPDLLVNDDATEESFNLECFVAANVFIANKKLAEAIGALEKISTDSDEYQDYGKFLVKVYLLQAIESTQTGDMELVIGILSKLLKVKELVGLNLPRLDDLIKEIQVMDKEQFNNNAKMIEARLMSNLEYVDKIINQNQ